jgi:hypothetical protein
MLWSIYSPNFANFARKLLALFCFKTISWSLFSEVFINFLWKYWLALLFFRNYVVIDFFCKDGRNSRKNIQLFLQFFRRKIFKKQFSPNCFPTYVCTYVCTYIEIETKTRLDKATIQIKGYVESPRQHSNIPMSHTCLMRSVLFGFLTQLT